jgi:Na+-translocating ferredoxin:NAD+ oxidoreductase RnfD subunit
VLLPRLSDPRLHLAAVIVSLQVIGQIGFEFQLSIAQILLSLGTAAVLEIAIAFKSKRVIMWPASALLTGNGVAFVLRVPGTEHGDWWSLRGWWIFVGTAAVSLLSKYMFKWRGEHVFNPSNIGLVLCFLVLGRGRATPLDFWWGPMSAWLALALALIVAGGFAILRRLSLLRVALGFWFSFAAGIGVLALSGHVMLARWHLGPISGFHFWWVLVTSPEVLVFLFFMITDPKTAPRAPRARLAYGIALGLLASVLIAPTTTEYASKVALLSSLALVCLALPVLRSVAVPLDRRVLLAATPVVAAALRSRSSCRAVTRATAFRPLPPGKLPPISILPSRGVETQLDRHTAQLIAHDLVTVAPANSHESLRVWLEPGGGQKPPDAVAQLGGRTYRLVAVGTRWSLKGKDVAPTHIPSVPVLAGYRLSNVAPAVGLAFHQGAFRYGVMNDPAAMMGGGLAGWTTTTTAGLTCSSSTATARETSAGTPPAVGCRAPPSSGTTTAGS